MLNLRTDQQIKDKHLYRNLRCLALTFAGFVLVGAALPDVHYLFWIGIGLFASGFVILVYLNRRDARGYRCPGCGKYIKESLPSTRSRDDAVRFYCEKCKTLWNTGDPHPDRSDY